GVHGRFDAPGGLLLVEVVEQHRHGEEGGGGVGDAAPGDVGGAAVHRLEDGVLLADVGARGDAETAGEAGHQVGEDVAEQVGGHQHVERLGVAHQLHGGGVDDDVVGLDVGVLDRKSTRLNSSHVKI